MVTVALLLAVASASAAPLNPGGTVYNPDVTAVIPLFNPSYTLSGVPANYSTLVATLVSNYTGGFTGQMTSKVYEDPNTGWLAFVYYLNNTTSPEVDMEHFTVGNNIVKPWSGVGIVDAGADSSGHSTADGLINWTDGDPYDLVRDPASTGSGVGVNFSIGMGTRIVPTSNDSALIWFATDAKNFQITNVGLLDNGTIGAATAYAPAPAVPEPASWTLLGLGFGVVGLVLRRRRS